MVFLAPFVFAARGVVKDFNYNSLHNPIGPLLIGRAEENGYIHIRVKGNLPGIIAFLKGQWEGFDPAHPFEFFFLDGWVNDQYKNEEMQNRLLSWLAGTCIFIALLGVFGLSAFSAWQRTKEIGIRKVLGANVTEIIFLLYKDIMVLVLIGALLAIPVSVYVFSIWLSNFAYKSDVNYYIFALVAFAGLLLSFTTALFYSWRAATINPVRSLKYE